MTKNAIRSRPEAPSGVKQHWTKLRVDYVNATPRQRLGPIADRLADPLHWGPNLLVTAISAIEAFARCLMVELLATSMRKSKTKVYEGVKVSNGPELVQQYLRLKDWETAPEVFGSARWESYVEAATKYRHLLVHECTYLNATKLTELNAACREMLEKLVELAGYKEHYERRMASARDNYKDITIKL